MVGSMELLQSMENEAMVGKLGVSIGSTNVNPNDDMLFVDSSSYFELNVKDPVVGSVVGTKPRTVTAEFLAKI